MSTPARAPRQHIPPSIPANDADMKNSTSKNLIPKASYWFSIQSGGPNRTVLYSVGQTLWWTNSDNCKSPQSIVEEHISEEEYHVPKPRPAKRKKKMSNISSSLNTSDYSEGFTGTANAESTKIQSFQDSGIMTEEVVVLTSTPKKPKRPRLEW